MTGLTLSMETTLAAQAAYIVDLVIEDIIDVTKDSTGLTESWYSQYGYKTYIQDLMFEEDLFEDIHDGRRFKLDKATAEEMADNIGLYPNYSRLLFALKALSLIYRHWKLIKTIKKEATRIRNRIRRVRSIPSPRDFSLVLERYAEKVFHDADDVGLYVQMSIQIAEVAQKVKLQPKTLVINSSGVVLPF
ncbi:hypothetical protein TWF481_011533 [Arthrobotrys musiformis]|uniref:Uncharacterized protein n=1 Tax=Arthrobotrys musiformis TaxID=47236 RepID=A0AAV9W015_9PEZI